MATSVLAVVITIRVVRQRASSGLQVRDVALTRGLGPTGSQVPKRDETPNVSFQQSASRPNSPGLLHRDPGFETFARMESAIGWAKSPSAAHDMDIDPARLAHPLKRKSDSAGKGHSVPVADRDG